MATLDVAFVKYYNEALSNAYLTMPQRITNLFPIPVYAKLIITNQGALGWHFMDDGSGRYVSATEFDIGLIDPNTTKETKVPLEASLPSETTRENFTVKIELYKDSQYTQLYATNNNTINVHMYIQQQDGSWSSSTLTEEEVVYKKWMTPIGANKYVWSKDTGYSYTVGYAHTADMLYVRYDCSTNTYKDYTQGFFDTESVLGVYSGIGVGYIGGDPPSWKGTLKIMDYDGTTSQPFTNKFVSMTMKNELGDNNVTGGLFASSITVESGKSYKLVVRVVNGWIGISRTAYTDATTLHMIIGDIVVFNPLP